MRKGCSLRAFDFKIMYRGCDFDTLFGWDVPFGVWGRFFSGTSGGFGVFSTLGAFLCFGDDLSGASR